MLVYKVTNLINNKMYIGKLVNSNKWSSYWGSGTCIKLAIDKYGKENFRKEIVEICESNEILNDREKFWIKTLNSMSPNGYNLTEGGEAPVMTQEVKDKIRESVFKLYL